MKALLLVVTILILSLSNINAQEDNDLMDLSLDELLNMEVTTASKKAQSISEAPAIISLITEEQIKVLGVNNLSELMSFVPGFARYDTYWKKGMITSRGIKQSLYNDKILLLVNGVPAYDGTTMEYFIDIVPITAVKRIEIIRGPGSTLYGTNAFSAVINIITKTGKDSKGIQAYASIGSFHTKDIGLSMGDQIGDISYYVGARMSDNEGYMKDVTDEANVKGKINYENDIESFIADLGYKGLRLTSGYSYEKWSKFGSVPLFIFGNDHILDLGKATQRKFYTNLSYEHNFSDKIDAKISLHYDSYLSMNPNGQFGKIAYNLGDNTLSPDYTRFGGKVFQGEVQFSYLLNDDFSLMSGFNAESRKVESVGDIVSDLDEQILKEGATKAEPFNISDIGAFIQIDGKIISKLGFVAGIRFTRLGINDESYLTPRGGLVYTFSKNSSIKALYGEAFRSPGAHEQYLNAPRAIYGPDILNKKLEPEKIQTMELAWDQSIFEKYKLRLNGFFTTVKDIIGRRTTTSSEREILKDQSAKIYDNLGDQEYYGGEFEFYGYPTELLSFFVNVSYKKGKDKTNDMDIMYLAEISANGGFTFKLHPKLHISPNIQFVGERKGSLVTGKINKVDPIFLLNANLKYIISDKFSSNIIVNNITDEKYFYPEEVRRKIAIIPGGPGVNFYIRINYGL